MSETEKKGNQRSGKETRGLLRRFLAYYGPHKKLFAMDMTASLLVALVGVVYPMITRTMLNDLIPNRNYRMVVIFGLTLLALYFIKMLLNYFIQYQGHMMGVYMQAQMRSDMFAHLEALPYGFYDTHETGKIMSRMTNDLFDVSELAHHGPENIIISVLSIVLAFVYLSTINIWLTLIVFAGGIGENSWEVRKLTCELLKEPFGIELDDDLNLKALGRLGYEGGVISKPSSKAKLFMIPTNEELVIARSAMKFVRR